VTWLLKLYPPRWRRRYGAELTEMIAAQPFSIGAAIDLVAGAIDAWVHPRLITAPGSNEREVPMSITIRRFACAGDAPPLTRSDKIKSTTINVGGTLMLALVWLAMVWQFRKNEYVLALAPMTYFLPYLVSLRYTSLKGRSHATQAILIASLGTLFTAFFLLVAWIGRGL
jgi:hypothetical protein